jgi:hypothetical protein
VIERLTIAWKKRVSVNVVKSALFEIGNAMQNSGIQSDVSEAQKEKY